MRPNWCALPLVVDLPGGQWRRGAGPAAFVPPVCGYDPEIGAIGQIKRD
jgi:hypothetical protein